MSKGFLKKNDPRGGHTRMYWDIQDSAAWLALSYSAQSLYMAMRRKLRKTNNGNIEATVSTMREHGFPSTATLFKALRELEAVGLIAKTRQGGIARSSKECNLFRFTDLETYEFPKQGVARHLPTNEWRKFKTLPDAEIAIEAAHRSAKKPPNKNEPCIQKMKFSTSETEAVGSKNASEIEQEGASLVQKLKLSQKDEQVAKHRAALLSAAMYACH